MNWNSEIDGITHSLQQEFGNLSFEQLTWKANSQEWSISENINHIKTVNQSYFPIFKDLISGNYKPHAFAKLKFLSSFFGKSILKSTQPSNPRKIKTFEIWEPQMSEPSNLLHDFSSHQEELKEWIGKCQKFIESDTVISSPANKIIVYPLSTAFDIIVTHEKRHLNQCREILKVIK